MHLSLPFEAAVEPLLDPAGDWKDLAIRSAKRQRFLFTIGEGRRSAEGVIVPLTWVPSSFETLLPALDGDLELSSLGADESRWG